MCKIVGLLNLCDKILECKQMVKHFGFIFYLWTCEKYYFNKKLSENLLHSFRTPI